MIDEIHLVPTNKKQTTHTQTRRPEVHSSTVGVMTLLIVDASTQINYNSVM